MTAPTTGAESVPSRSVRGWVVQVAGYDPGIYWSASAGEAKAWAWRQFEDAFGRARSGDFWRRVRARRAPAFDGAFAGRQGLLPEFAMPQPITTEAP